MLCAWDKPSTRKWSDQLPHSTADVYSTCMLVAGWQNSQCPFGSDTEPVRSGVSKKIITAYPFHPLRSLLLLQRCWSSLWTREITTSDMPRRSWHWDAEESHTNTPHCTHTPWEHATQSLLPRSVLVDHVTVLLFLWRPNGGGLAIANALATAGGETSKKRMNREAGKEVEERRGED